MRKQCVGCGFIYSYKIGIFKGLDKNAIKTLNKCPGCNGEMEVVNVGEQSKKRSVKKVRRK